MRRGHKQSGSQRPSKGTFRDEGQCIQGRVHITPVFLSVAQTRGGDVSSVQEKIDMKRVSTLAT